MSVLREVIAGDTLGPPQASPTSSPMCAFQLSGKAYPDGLIQELIAKKLLRADKEFGVIATESGQRYFTQHR